VPIKTALSLPLFSWTGESKYDERLEGKDKDRERSLTNYCHRQNRLNLGRKGSLTYHQSNQILKHLPTQSFFPGSTSLLFLSCLPPSGAGGEGMEVTVSSSRVVSHAPSSSGGGLLTLCPCSSVRSLSWETVLHKLLQQGFFPEGFSSSLTAPAWVPSHRVQSFRNRLVQRGSPQGHKPY